MQNRYSNTNYDRNNQSRNEFRNDRYRNDQSYETRRDYDDTPNYSGNMNPFENRSHEGIDFGRSRDTENRTHFGYGTENYSSRGLMDNDYQQKDRGLFSGKGPKGYKRSDSRIHEDACDALTHDAFVDASDIDIKVENAVVTLTGTVEDRRMKRKAEECVEQCRGVEDVQNNLKVKDANLWEKVTGQEAKDAKTKTSTAGRLQ